MRLAQKLILFALAVALLPLAATGFTLVSLGEQALRERIAAHQRSAASALAAKVDQAVEEMSQRTATVLELVDVMELTPVEREGVLIMLYRQSPDISVAVLLDAQGAALAPAVFVETADPNTRQLAGHPVATQADVERVTDHVRDMNAAGAAHGAVLLSPAYFPDASSARVTLAIPCCFEAAGKPRAIAGVELALRADILRVEGIDTGRDSRVFIVDGEGRVIAHPEKETGSSLAQHGAVASFLGQRGLGSTRYRDDGIAHLAAFAPVGSLGWAVVVEQPETIAFAAAAQMRARTLGWILGTTAVVLLTGLLFAARLRATLARIVAGARAFGEGRLDQRIAVRSGDEIGELAGTMNDMAEQLAKSLTALEEWNRTLEQRVDERTRELREAQSQLLMQSKLAAIGQLGAGVAHEVNNPLVGILGFTQLLLKKAKADAPERATLEKIEQAALRCREITTKLLRFSERHQASGERVPVDGVVTEALDLIEGSITAAGLSLARRLEAGAAQVSGDPGQLSLVLVNLLANAVAATPAGGGIEVRTEAGERELRVVVRDTGRGIAPEHLPRIFDPFFTTKTVWTGVGLGLSVAYRIVTDHGGRIDVQSTPGEGSTFTVVLPRAEAAASAPQRHTG